MNIKELDSKYIAATYARFPVEIVRGEGSLVFDENGRSYIDLGSGIAANIFGYDDKQWVEAVTGASFPECSTPQTSTAAYPALNLRRCSVKRPE